MGSRPTRGGPALDITFPFVTKRVNSSVQKHLRFGDPVLKVSPICVVEGAFGPDVVEVSVKKARWRKVDVGLAG
jgi:hypothetical protein